MNQEASDADPRLTIVITATYRTSNGGRYVELDGRIDGPMPADIDSKGAYRFVDECVARLGELLLPGAETEYHLTATEGAVDA